MVELLVYLATTLGPSSLKTKLEVHPSMGTLMCKLTVSPVAKVALPFAGTNAVTEVLLNVPESPTLMKAHLNEQKNLLKIFANTLPMPLQLPKNFIIKVGGLGLVLL